MHLIFSVYQQGKKRLISFNIYVAQVKRFKPQLVAVRNESLIAELEEALNDVEQKPEIIPGEQGVIEVDIWFVHMMMQFGLENPYHFS